MEVHQNAQVPTGYLNVHMTDSRVARVNVPDVNEEVKYLNEQGVNCYIHDVPQENVFLKACHILKGHFSGIRTDHGRPALSEIHHLVSATG